MEKEKVNANANVIVPPGGRRGEREIALDFFGSAGELQSLPCQREGDRRASARWWRDSVKAKGFLKKESPSHGFAVPAPFRKGAFSWQKRIFAE